MQETGSHAQTPATREIATRRVREAVAALADLGVSALVTGSLARGEYEAGSDIDLLVTSCPPHLKYAIEGIVEDHLHGHRFDVVYQDEIPPWKLRHFRERAVDARDLA
ncbi:nucleotidyltransferase family protein [Methylobacterium iners]|uniref:Polymerase nucleotidyl transferase domain-containing protein n=2 Tax=Methylobacterium iners TaxID=418707 RepID=A0ABQ4RYR2_9HYPH|nr:nucleotidyltransferase domain-containing protein [Methylobacterium iners]GJD95323.1 hypothetical protein OCOJLMKI_2535 [Methylobacterium iners]